jgi:hypothetical protein
MSGDLKVRDLIKRRELPDRSPIGARLAQRLGARMFERPNVCFSARLYKRFGLADPWDPTGPRDDPDPVALGPVAVRLGEKRRQPAPHLRPKTPKKKKQQAADPLAKWRRPAPKPKATPEPAPAPRPTTAPAPAPPPGAPPQAAGPSGRAVPLPVRPDLAALQEKKGIAPPPRPTPVPPSKPAPARVPGPPGPGGGGMPGQRGGMRPPMPPKASPKRRAGRMRARAVRAPAPDLAAPPPPEVVEIAPPAAAPAAPVVIEAPPPAPAPAPAPPPRRAAPTGPAGLDDLFGMGQQEGRMRMRRRKKDPPEEP